MRAFSSFKFFLLVLVGALAACTGNGEDRLGRNLVAPGGYEFYDCPQLALQQKALTNRDVELTRLMDKARQGPGGGFVSAVAYESDYAANRASLREIEREQTNKNCVNAPQAAPPAVPVVPNRAR